MDRRHDIGVQLFWRVWQHKEDVCQEQDCEENDEGYARHPRFMVLDRQIAERNHELAGASALLEHLPEL